MRGTPLASLINPRSSTIDHRRGRTSLRTHQRHEQRLRSVLLNPISRWRSATCCMILAEVTFRHGPPRKRGQKLRVVRSAHGHWPDRDVCADLPLRHHSTRRPYAPDDANIRWTGQLVSLIKDQLAARKIISRRRNVRVKKGVRVVHTSNKELSEQLWSATIALAMRLRLIRFTHCRMRSGCFSTRLSSKKAGVSET